uniref:Uncharacterized protein n=1 Tax=Euplotes crassus TaxID=5936 RepID=A0A7S3K9U0_EUPCR|mmetsp:Transcript_17018/g.16705  ORF Transcript_17018/g.16705 Transcript_17018/m.16705 type:complete len:111 (+) Transcript_17018:213-545(+)
MEFFPFLGTITGKAIFYIILGTFCLDKEFNFIGLIGGFLCFLVGLAWLLYDYIYYKKPRAVVNAGVSGVYAENKHKFAQNDFNNSFASEYSLQSIQAEDARQNDYKPPDL